jgi:hypothetical protein
MGTAKRTILILAILLTALPAGLASAAEEHPGSYLDGRRERCDLSTGVAGVRGRAVATVAFWRGQRSFLTCVFVRLDMSGWTGARATAVDECVIHENRRRPFQEAVVGTGTFRVNRFGFGTLSCGGRQDAQPAPEPEPEPEPDPGPEEPPPDN